MDHQSLILGGLYVLLGVFILTLMVQFFRNPHVYRGIKLDLIKWLNRRAHSWLLKHDDSYRYRHISDELVRRRNQARAQGASADELD